MRVDFRWVDTDVVYRYARTGDERPVQDGYATFGFTFRPRDADLPRLMLERGISSPAVVDAVDGERRAVVLLRSSPHKAGSDVTPWHDEFDLDAGTVVYHGDARPGQEPDRAGGNKTLSELARYYFADSREFRKFAPPLALFRGESGVLEGGRSAVKGFVRFIGIALPVQIEEISGFETQVGRFDNLVFHLRLVPLDDTDGRVAWKWIDDRRDRTLDIDVANLCAPYAWRHWIETGMLPATRTAPPSPTGENGAVVAPPQRVSSPAAPRSGWC